MARAERITLQEASELSGVSIPTIYRRIRNGELRGAICIDASGKHWELFKSDLPKLTLKRKKRSTEALPAVQVADETSSEITDNFASIAEVEDVAKDNSVSAEISEAQHVGVEIKNSLEQELLVKNAVLVERCADLEHKLKQLREELDSAKDDASYWRGRWEQISINFDALRKMLEDKSNDDQELIWDLRGQVADLQERLDDNYTEDNNYAAPSPTIAEEQTEEETQANIGSYPTASYPFVTAEMEAEVGEQERASHENEPQYAVSDTQEEEPAAEPHFEVSYKTSDEQPRVTAELLYDFNTTNIDNQRSLMTETDPDGEIYPEPDFGDVSSSSLTSADDINPIETYAPEQPKTAAIDSAATAVPLEKENSLSVEIHEQAEEEAEVQEHVSSKLSSFPTARNIKFSMRHPKGRQGKRGRKRIPPLR